MILHKPIAASDMDKKALKLSPLLWSSFDSLCSAGEVVDPSSIWDRDAEALDTLEYCTGANPVMNLVNCSSSATPPPVFVPTPVRHTPQTKLIPDKLSTPQQPTITVGSCPDTPANNVETPLLYCNSISSTPLHLANSPSQMSGISALNITADSDISQTQLKLPAFMPPPLRYEVNYKTLKYYNSIIILDPKLSESLANNQTTA